MLFYTPLNPIRSFANIDDPVTFLLYDLECQFLFEMTWIYVQLILEYKNIFRKYQSFLKTHKGILGHALYSIHCILSCKIRLHAAIGSRVDFLSKQNRVYTKQDRLLGAYHLSKPLHLLMNLTQRQSMHQSKRIQRKGKRQTQLLA